MAEPLEFPAPTATASANPMLRVLAARGRAGSPPRHEVVWQPRFAYGSAGVIVAVLTVVSLPLWIVVFRASGSAPISDLLALCMMLAGAYVTGAATWLIITEMRGRVRMVDTLARTGEREAMAAPMLPGLDTPVAGYLPEPITVSPVGPVGQIPVGQVPMAPIALPLGPERTATGGWQAPPMPAAVTARVEAQQADAAATLEASSHLLASFSGVLKSFGQFPAQAAMLSIALVLFVGATLLSLG